LLLQLFEEGHLTDSLGRKVDFRNTIIIMTSNLGSELIRRNTEVGFGVKEGMIDYETMKEKIDKAMRKHFKPELLNRIDSTVIFRMLSDEQLSYVIDLEISKLQKRLDSKGITLTIDAAAKEHLKKVGYKPEMGARSLRRSIVNMLEDPLAEKLLLSADDTEEIVVSLADGDLIFSDKKEKKKATKKLAETKEASA
ncbi:MAG TPA: AAA family ATPase, partial [Chlamydiales bacterium]|nr:AAA family ATPase [Chlamydiales bacterium]